MLDIFSADFAHFQTWGVSRIECIKLTPIAPEEARLWVPAPFHQTNGIRRKRVRRQYSA